VRADRRIDMMKLIDAFHNFENAPKTCIPEEIERRLNSGNVCHYSLQILFYSTSLLKNVKVKIRRTVILFVVSYLSEVWPLAPREKHRLRVFENSVLREIFVLRGTW
jgi:hypothetical protein